MQKPRFVHKKFNLKEFIQQVWSLGGYQVSDPSRWPHLKVWEDCAGTGMVSHVLKAMLGADKVTAIGVSEKSPAAAMFLMKNRQCTCIYTDMKLVEEAMLERSGRRVPCFAHGRLCVLPPAEEAIYACGFDMEKASKDDFSSGGALIGKMIAKHIGIRKPRFSLLEAPSTVKASKLMSEALANIPGCTAAVVDCSAHPLPTNRPRSCWYVSREASEDACKLKEEYEQLRDKVHAELQAHHAQDLLSGLADTRNYVHQLSISPS